MKVLVIAFRSKTTGEKRQFAVAIDAISHRALQDTSWGREIASMITEATAASLNIQVIEADVLDMAKIERGEIDF